MDDVGDIGVVGAGLEGGGGRGGCLRAGLDLADDSAAI